MTVCQRQMEDRQMEKTPQYYIVEAAALPEMRLSAVRICGASYDIEIGRTSWTVRQDGRVLSSGRTNGERVFIGR